jgi:hypothetical protein
MGRWLSGLWMVINRPPCDEDADSARVRFGCGSAALITVSRLPNDPLWIVKSATS